MSYVGANLIVDDGSVDISNLVTVTNFDAGNLKSRYYPLGTNLVMVRFSCEVSNVTGVLTVTLPNSLRADKAFTTPPLANDPIIGEAFSDDGGGTDFVGSARLNAASDVDIVFSTPADWNIAVPHVWAIGSTLSFTVIYTTVEPVSLNTVSIDVTAATLTAREQPWTKPVGAGGLALSINGGDTTQFDVSAGKYQIADSYTNPEVPSVTTVTYVGSAGNAFPAGLAANERVYVGLNSIGGIVTQVARPDNEDLDTILWIGSLHTTDNVNISETRSYIVDSSPQSKQLNAIGPITAYERFVPTVVAAQRQLNLPAGKLFSVGRNYHSDRANPNLLDIPAQSPMVFDYLLRDGTIDAAGVNTFDFQTWDNNGAADTVALTEVTVQRIYLDEDGKLFVQYGQEEYTAYTTARERAVTERFFEAPQCKNAMLIAVVVCLESASDFDTPNTQARVVPVSQFGAKV